MWFKTCSVLHPCRAAGMMYKVHVIFCCFTSLLGLEVTGLLVTFYSAFVICGCCLLGNVRSLDWSRYWGPLYNGSSSIEELLFHLLHSGTKSANHAMALILRICKIANKQKHINTSRRAFRIC